MILKKGINSPDVVNLELVLQGLGFTGFTVDGNFDDKTENVIKYIQKAHGLDVDGQAGPKTLALLDDLYEPLVANFAPQATPEVPEDKPGEFAVGLEELASVNARLSKKVLDVIRMADGEGYILTTVQGLRTFAQQDKLFAQRPRVTKARGGQSYHNYGVAVDLAFVVNGKINWDDKLYKGNMARWAGRAGLESGANWRFVDYPHMQLAGLPGVGDLRKIYDHAGGGQLGVQAVWNKFVG